MHPRISPPLQINIDAIVRVGRFFSDAVDAPIRVALPCGQRCRGKRHATADLADAMPIEWVADFSISVLLTGAHLQVDCCFFHGDGWWWCFLSEEIRFERIDQHPRRSMVFALDRPEGDIWNCMKFPGPTLQRSHKQLYSKEYMCIVITCFVFM